MLAAVRTSVNIITDRYMWVYAKLIYAYFSPYNAMLHCIGVGAGPVGTVLTGPLFSPR